MMPSFLYFAYGSNMLTERLAARCPSAWAICIGRLSPCYDLVFCKRSVDGSGKAGVIERPDSTSGAQTYGVIFELSGSDRDALDRYEGDGYARHDAVSVNTGSGGSLVCTSYIAQSDALEPQLKPYDWYLAVVIAGAKQHKLPDAYIEALQAVPSQPDPNRDRKTRLEVLDILQEIDRQNRLDGPTRHDIFTTLRAGRVGTPPLALETMSVEE